MQSLFFIKYFKTVGNNVFLILVICNKESNMQKVVRFRASALAPLLLVPKLLIFNKTAVGSNFYLLLIVAATDKKYFARRKFSMNLVYKKKV